MVLGRDDKREPLQEKTAGAAAGKTAGAAEATGLERAFMYHEKTLFDELVRRLDHVTLKLRGNKAKNQEL